MDNNFNLIDEPWIKISNHTDVSLRQLFSDYSLIALGGNSVEKICVLKFFLALAQTTCTPENTKEWANLSIKEISKKTLKYLDDNFDLFFLFGKKPFLQMSFEEQIEKEYKSLQFHTASSENSTFLFQSHMSFKLHNSEKVYVLLQTLGYAFGGKKCGKIDGKLITILPSPALGSSGYLHSFLKGSSILETIKLNLITTEQIASINYLEYGLGCPPWENMPVSRTCLTAKKLKKTYLGRLIPINRFVLLKEDKVFITKGIEYPLHKEGGFDLSISCRKSDQKALWSDPEKRPWRQITSLLEFVDVESDSKKRFDCFQLKFGFENMKTLTDIIKFGIWSGGIKVSSDTGEQSIKANDDYVESEIDLNSSIFSGYGASIWYCRIKENFKTLEKNSNILYASICKYFTFERGKNPSINSQKIARQSVNLFWQDCEQDFKNLNIICSMEFVEYSKNIIIFQKKNFRRVQEIYDESCFSMTSRQMNSWAKNRPKSYIKE